MTLHLYTDIHISDCLSYRHSQHLDHKYPPLYMLLLKYRNKSTHESMVNVLPESRTRGIEFLQCLRPIAEIDQNQDTYKQAVKLT